MSRRACRNGTLVLSALLCMVLGRTLLGQTNPVPIAPPVNQNWGSAAFSTMPSGFAAWAGLSGGSITTQAKAEISVPNQDASPIRTTTPADGNAGGVYCYAVGSDARFGILTSSNTSNGVDQLAMAIDATGLTGITIAYDLINIVANVRTVGSVCQYRVGTSGTWTTLSGTNNPYAQSGGTVGDVTSASVTLPPDAENQPVVQIRWATWRATGTGNSSGYAIDNISVNGAGGCIISSLTLSGGPSYNLDETAIATVTLNQAPDTSATVNVSSGAFATVPITINAPDTTGQAEVSMANAGTYTATATAVSGCGGSANSSSFNVIGTPAAAFASTGVNTIDDTSGNGNGYIDPGENGIKLFLEITNNGTADATGVSATLNSLTGTTTVSSAVQGYPNIAIGANGTNALPFQISVSPSQICGNTISLQLAVTSNEGSSAFQFALPTCPPANDQYEPPADYYLTATGTGATLKAQLHNIISKNYWNGFLSSPNQNFHSYDDAKAGLQITDLDPNNANDVILIYTGISVAKPWDGGVTWNREHQWPNSLGINGVLPAYGDLHHLRPCNPSVNSSRGNSPYGIGGGYWDPDHGAPVRGSSSRTMFYMNTRYNGTAPDASLNLVLVNGQPSGSQMGDLAAMMQWHYAYPVNNNERRRNYLVFSNVANPTYYQGNRNPYIDHPEFVWTIYGTGPNDSTLYVGAAPAGDGSSAANVNLGAILVNAPLPAPQTVALNKTGVDPTTFNINLGGAASSADAGPRQAFIGGTQNRSIAAGLTGSTATAGLKTGSLTIDNTDLSSAATGEGSADADDTVNVSLTILDHANASFSSSGDANSLTIDFGDVAVGSAPVTQGFSIYNMVATAGYTARLDLDSISGSGDTARLYTDLAAFSNLNAGASNSFTASFDPAATGNFSAVYTITNSDENLAGAGAGINLILTLTGRGIEPTCANPGDMNLDSLKNGNDIAGFVACLLGGGSNCPCADTNGDHVVNEADIPSFTSLLLAP